MTAVLSEAELFVDRGPLPGDRVHCSPVNGMSFIARVVGPACYGGGDLQVQRVDNLDCVNVAPTSVRVFAAASR